MKIIIIGAGISGLTLHHFLRQHLPGTHTITLIESYPQGTTSTLSGLSLAPNALRILNAVSPELLTHLLAPGNSFQTGTRTLRNAKGKLLMTSNIGSKDRYGYPSIMVTRHVLYSALEKLLPAGAARYGVKVREVREVPGGVEVHFADGTVEMADLVLGADGVRSVVRPAVVGEGFDAVYRGLTSITGIIPASSLTNPPSYSTFTFGPTKGFFGLTPVTDPQGPDPKVLWWSSWPVPTPAPRLAPPALSEVRRTLLERHSEWAAPEGETGFQEVLRAATEEGREVLVLPTWITPPLEAFGSASGRVLVLGDAAHAMPPDTGFGAALAVEDSEVYARLLGAYLGRVGEVGGPETEVEGLRCAARAFEGMRMGRVGMVLKEGLERGDRKMERGRWHGVLRDWVIWVRGWLPEGGGEDWKFGYKVEVEVERWLEGEKKL